MSFSTRYSHEAEKAVARLDQTMRRRVDKRMEELEVDPYNPRISKQLRHDVKGLRSSRLGAWRIIYEVHDNARVICVVSIGPRGQVYKRL